MIKELNTVAKNSVLAFVGRSMGIFLNYIFTVLIAHLLNAHLMGSFFLGVTVITILTTLARFGLDQGTLRFVSVYRGEGRHEYVKGTILRSCQFSFITGIIIGISLFIFSDFLALRIFRDQNVGIVFKLLSFAIPFFSVWVVILESLRGLRSIFLIVLNRNIIFPLISILFLLFFYVCFGKHVISVSMAYTVSILIASGLAVLFLIKAFPEILKIPPTSKFTEVLKYSLPLLFVSAMWLVISWIDVIMIGIMKTSKDVAVYTAAAKTATFVAFFLYSVNAIAPPIFAELYSQGKIIELGIVARKSARWICYFSLPVAALFILLSKEIMSIYGHKFVAGIWALGFLSIGQLINASAGSVGYILSMTGYQNKLCLIIFVSCLANVILNLALIPTWGISGAGLATGFSLVLLNILMTWTVYNVIGIKTYTGRMARLLSICGMAILAFYCFHHFTSVYLSAVVFLIVYFGLLLLIGFQREDLEFLFLVKSKLKEKLIDG